MTTHVLTSNMRFGIAVAAFTFVALLAGRAYAQDPKSIKFMMNSPAAGYNAGFELAQVNDRLTMFDNLQVAIPNNIQIL